MPTKHKNSQLQTAQDSNSSKNVEDKLNKPKHSSLMNHFIGSRTQIPNILVDNKFIHKGYRINYDSILLNIKSLFHKHNELINVWTHLIGAFIALAAIIYISLNINDIEIFKEKIYKDVHIIFDPVWTEITDIGSQINESFRKIKDHEIKFEQLIAELDRFENSIITSDSYKELLVKISETKELFNFLDDSVLVEYSNIIEDKFSSIKNNLIQQIDSEQFDWVEIYKHNYTHLIENNIISQQEQLRKSTDPNHISRWPIIIFLISAIFCLLGSALFHLFYQQSQTAFRYLQRVDYAGISLLVCGSTFPPFYYGFYCDILLQTIYLFVIGFCCTTVYIISIFDFIHQEKYRKIKGIMYGSLGILAGVPTFHLYLRELVRGEISDYLPFKDTFINYIIMGTSYLGGLAIYTLRIPERFFPGKFDIIGHSHQIWHLCVCFGVLFSYFGAMDNLHDRRETFCII